MAGFFKLFFAAAIPAAVVIFAAAIGHNSWQRAAALALVFAFLFGSLVAQVMTLVAEKRRNRRANTENKQND